MQSRCPFPDCASLLELADKQPFDCVDCSSCGRQITARTLERFCAIDKVKAQHHERGTLASAELAGSLFAAEPPPFVGILEEIRSLWNVGSIFRSSDGCGFGQLFLVGITGSPPRNEIAKTSLGAEDYVRWRYAAACCDILPGLKARGYQIVALEKAEHGLAIDKALEQNLLRAPLCLIVGNEVTGIYRETLDQADIVVDMPMRGIKSSFNVAVAFGIAAYLLSGQLSPPE